MTELDHRNNPKGQQPVAYDPQGQPLYAAPQAVGSQEAAKPTQPAQPSLSDLESSARNSHVTSAPQAMPGHGFDPQMRVQYSNEPGVIHATRQIEPEELEVSQEMMEMHKKSKKKYPYLNLSKGECVILNIHRHPIGLLLPVLATAVVWVALIVLLVIYPVSSGDTLSAGLPSYQAVLVPVLLLMLLSGIGGYIAIWVYLQNQFFLTNESVIQEIQHSLFSRREQTVSLGSIEDASFKQKGILQTMLNYGTIRLSTEGEETTYRFAYVEDPKRQVAVLNNAVEAFKNGRPVNIHDN